MGFGDVQLNTIKIVRVACTAIHGTALATTIYRVFHQLNIGLFSWDDGLAFVSFFMDATAVTCLWVMAHFNDTFAQTTREVFHQRRIIIWWILNTASLCELWFSRMSLAYTFFRFLPNGRARIISIMSTIAFTLCWIPTFSWRLYVCTRDTVWADQPRDTCTTPRILDLIDICLDALSSICLLLLAAHVLWQMRFPRKEPKMITLLTGGSFYAVAVIFHSIFTLTGKSSYQIYMAQIEGALSLVTCNILVIMTSVYLMMFYRDRNYDDHQKSLFNHQSIHHTPTPVSLDQISHRSQNYSRFQSSCSSQLSETDSGSRSSSNPENHESVLTFTDVASSACEPGNSRGTRRSSYASDSASHRYDDSQDQSKTDSTNHVKNSSSSNTQNDNASNNQEFVYLTDSEPCSGSIIIIPDPSGSEEGNGAYHSSRSSNSYVSFDRSYSYSYSSYPPSLSGSPQL
ncbi:hypothetical protein K435DRAFT_962669 [Dendrothele bispora CBS 962.96]|uniref:Uncharacterized protein n=1 Tax=Dendrothele bispora (strain CBS 962.96) TaxID=1314807 RepID=A0A4S8MJN0_DENBC|nr:hypothetical protein K435DRAFT_962669 [Dendrothele bispora CBS 962.96]